MPHKKGALESTFLNRIVGKSFCDTSIRAVHNLQNRDAKAPRVSLEEEYEPGSFCPTAQL